jgi:tetrahydromethanopterin S-methyltransferase subunit C
VLGLFGLAALLAAAIAALALVLPVWASALIVGAVVLVVAGVLALLGTRKLKSGVPPIPEQAITSVQLDARAVKESGRRES